MDNGSNQEPSYFELNKGAKIPSVGVGTWKAEPGVVGQAVKAAVKAGYSHIDCAKVYLNEKEVGEALEELFCSGVVSRSDMFITSKLWCSDHDPGDVSKSLSKSLEDLQLDYIDLYLIHWPFRMKSGSSGWETENFLPLCLSETWSAMEGAICIRPSTSHWGEQFHDEEVAGPFRLCKSSACSGPSGVPSCVAAT